MKLKGQAGFAETLFRQVGIIIGDDPAYDAGNLSVEIHFMKHIAVEGCAVVMEVEGDIKKQKVRIILDTSQAVYLGKFLLLAEHSSVEE